MRRALSASNRSLTLAQGTEIWGYRTPSPSDWLLTSTRCNHELPLLNDDISTTDDIVFGPETRHGLVFLKRLIHIYVSPSMW